MKEKNWWFKKDKGQDPESLASVPRLSKLLSVLEPRTDHLHKGQATPNSPSSRGNWKAWTLCYQSLPNSTSTHPISKTFETAEVTYTSLAEAQKQAGPMRLFPLPLSN